LVWNAREIEDSDDFYIYQQWSWLLRFLGWINHFGILVPLAVMGIFLTAKQWRKLWLLYAMILSLATSVAIFYVFGRYRFPLVPFLGLFAGAGIAAAVTQYRKRSFRPLTIAAVIALSTAIIVNWPLLGLRGPGPSGYNNLANAYSKEGKIDRAIETAKMAIAIEPNHGIAQFNLGNLYAALGKFDLARPRFEETLRIYPNYAEAHSNLGQLLAQQGNLKGGIREFHRAIELNPSLGGPYLNLGIAFARQGRTEEAVHALQDAARLAPESAEAHYTLGSLYASQGRYDQAAKAFNEALRVQGDFAAAHQSLAQLLVLQGRKEEAVQHYQEALRLMGKQGATTSPP
jgi:tetratricopeptide (TPR) repeat protein